MSLVQEVRLEEVLKPVLEYVDKAASRFRRGIVVDVSHAKDVVLWRPYKIKEIDGKLVLLDIDGDVVVAKKLPDGGVYVAVVNPELFGVDKRLLKSEESPPLHPDIFEFIWKVGGVAVQERR